MSGLNLAKELTTKFDDFRVIVCQKALCSGESYLPHGCFLSPATSRSHTQCPISASYIQGGKVSPRHESVLK